MKCTLPEISWHNREPVLSIDIHPISENFYRLATGGADCHVLIWQLNICENGAVKIEALSDLTRHQKAVNSVRWSNTGQYLATADDDANIIIWQPKTDNIPLLEGESGDKEIWIVHKVLRGHKEDIYDVCWSPNSQKLLSGSIDNTAILWDFSKGKNECILTDHKGFVQGVSWDPKGVYIATISTDRICRVFESSGKQLKARLQRGFLPVPQDHYLYKKDVKFFHDDTFKSFFRRLDFSPDGSLLAVPSGRVEIEDCKKILNATYVFAVDNWLGPVAVFPSGKHCSTVVRFCPILYELHEDGPEPIISLPFRMIMAVGTDHDVILYDTQQVAPFAFFRDIHYTRLTDLTWSKDGLLLVASSTDGFCALITFEPDELGTPYVKEESEPEDVLNVSGCEELDKDENLDVSKEKNTESVKPRKPSLLEQWTIKTPKRNRDLEKTDNKVIGDNTCQKKIVGDTNFKTENVHKRITPIAVLSSTNTEASRPVKVSPLLNFLKGAKDKINESKEKTRLNPAKKQSKKDNPVTSLPPVDLTLDDIEARDAWKCEKNESKSIEKDTNTMTMEDYTEEFSLHLEDSNVVGHDASESRSKNVESAETRKKVKNVEGIGTEEVNKEENKSKSSGIHKNTMEVDNHNEELDTVDADRQDVTKNKSAETREEVKSKCQKLGESRGEEPITENKEVNTENSHTATENEETERCVQITNSKDCIVSEKVTSIVKHTPTLDTNTIPTKRRIPLITLSSPKRKKT